MRGKLLKRALVAVLAATSTLAGITVPTATADEVTPMIIGGSPADTPYTVELQSFQPDPENPVRHECGGAYVAASGRNYGWVLTMAHCTDYAGVGSQARFGSLYWAKGGYTARVIRVVNHPEFDPNVGLNDIALLQVRFDRPVAKRLPRLPIAWSGNPGTITRVFGWGTLCDLDITIPECRKDIPDRLQQLDLRLLKGVSTDPKESCSLVDPATGYDYFKPSSMLCYSSADGQARAACFGDSGSPLTRVLPHGQRAVVALVLTDGDSLEVHPNLCTTGQDGSVPGKLIATSVVAHYSWIISVLYSYDKAAHGEVKQAQYDLAA